MPIVCEACTQVNRDVAVFCKGCGVRLEPEPDPEVELDGLVGLDELKGTVRRLVRLAEVNPAAVRGRNLHTILYGRTGTGKSHVATIIYRLFHKHGLTATDRVVVMDVTGPADFERALSGEFGKAKGGILFVDNAHRLVQPGVGGSAPLDRLLSKMDAAGYDPVVVLAGLRRGIKEYVHANPEVASRFGYVFELPDLDGDQLFQIASGSLAAAGLRLSPAAADRLRRLFRHLVKTKDPSFSNARAATAQAESVRAAYHLRVGAGGLADGLVHPADVEAEIPAEKTLDDIMRELDAFVGMGAVKGSVRAITQQIQIERRRAEQGFGTEAGVSRHFIITGNPGTGKTTVARKLGEIFEAIGMLDRGHVVDVGGNDLVGRYLGETPQKVNELCDRALGGVLFVDEAYALAGTEGGTPNAFGQEAVDTLLKRMEDDRGKLVVIAAGYRDEMERFVEMNPGLASRFDLHLHIDDYCPDELAAIFRSMARNEGYALAAAADERLGRIAEHLYATRPPDFGNGRTVRRLFDASKSALATRLAAVPDETLDREAFTTFESGDLAYDLPEAVTLDDVLGELNGLIGLESVKGWIRDLADLLAVQKRRAELTGQRFAFPFHLVLTGNPGTGKTTVARLLGRTLKALGILPRGHVVETDRKDLVASYVGQTAPKTARMIDRAVGGVLFIDEAYTLASDAFGKEAIDTLLKQMEDRRGEFVTVVAGYPREMGDFLDANPGLRGRFNEHFALDDYTPPELTAIFERMAAGQHYRLADGLGGLLLRHFAGLYDARDRSFDNARAVRRLLERTVVRQNKRLVRRPDATEGDYALLTPDDVPGLEARAEADAGAALAELDGLIGLQRVKEEVRGLTDYLRVQELDREAGLRTGDLNLHFVFQGNPGTGKTTVARLLARVFEALGVLGKGHLVEVSEKDLVGTHVGHTAPKTDAVIDRAMGGVLFIDEAYTLARSSFGLEAIDTLLVRMENDRGKFVVIAAGYPREMAAFVGANSGLQSRFTRFIDFEDYLPEELAAIFHRMARQEGLTLAADVAAELAALTRVMYDARGEGFANGRAVRNVFERAKQNRAVRLVRESGEHASVLTVSPALEVADVSQAGWAS
jgi:SpoVK/Ycf46/Vps4 family AAA+-type ATPase